MPEDATKEESKKKPLAYDPLKTKPPKKIPTPDSAEADQWSTALTLAPKGSLLLISDRFNYLNYSKSLPNLQCQLLSTRDVRLFQSLSKWPKILA
jgi:hypothetical protein